MTRKTLRSTYLRLRRTGLEWIAAELPVGWLDDVRLAVTEELARRGYPVISPRRRRKAA